MQRIQWIERALVFISTSIDRSPMSLVLIYNFVIIEANASWWISIWNVCKETSWSSSPLPPIALCSSDVIIDILVTTVKRTTTILSKNKIVSREKEKALCSSRIFLSFSLDAILLFKSRFLAGCILVLIGCLLLLIALLSWFLARNNRRQQQRNKVKQPSATTKPLIPVTKEKPLPAPSNGRLPPPRSIEPIVKPSSPPSPTPPTLAAGTIIRLSHSPIKGERSATPPESQKRNRPAVTLTRESSTATDEDDEAGYNIFLRHHHPTLPPVPHETDEEYEERFSLQMNKSEELGLGYLTNGFPPPHLPSTDNRPILYPYEHRTGLIKPLNIGADVPQRYTKYVSSYSKFVLPRPVQSTTDYPLR